MEAGVLVTIQGSTDVSAARREMLRAVRSAQFTEELGGAAAIVATEAASNILKHAGSGEIVIHRVSSEAGDSVEIMALDNGPGIANQSRCFEDGYSTAGSAGTGLGAIARLAQFCDIYSSPDHGTVLVARLGTERSPKTEVEVGAASVPYPGEEVCGDTWAIHRTSERTRILIADGLGHGHFAAKASQLAVLSISESRHLSPADVLSAAHLRLKPTRGSAASVADVDFLRQTVDFAGIGNVAGSVIPEPSLRRQMVTNNGTLGYELRKVQQYCYPAAAGSLVILHSDGLSTSWSLDKYPGLFQRHPSVIAAVLFRDFRRTKDDATIVVLRAGKNAK